MGKKRATYCQTFQSLGEMLDFAESPTTMPDDTRESCRETSGGHSGYGGTKSLAEACTLGREGWADPRAEVEILAAEIAADAYQDAQSHRPAPVFDVAGFDVDMGRYVTGDPECMIDWHWEPDTRTDRVYTVLIGGAVSSGVSEDAIRRRGAALLALVDLLATVGVSVEIWCEYAATGRGSATVSTLVRVKASDQAFDLDRLTFALMHPAMLRRVAWSCWEHLSDAGRKSLGIGSDYGWPHPPLAADEIGADLVLRTQPGWSCPEIARPVEWIVQQLEQATHKHP